MGTTLAEHIWTVRYQKILTLPDRVLQQPVLRISARGYLVLIAFAVRHEATFLVYNRSFVDLKY